MSYLLLLTTTIATTGASCHYFSMQHRESAWFQAQVVFHVARKHLLVEFFEALFLTITLIDSLFSQKNANGKQQMTHHKCDWICESSKQEMITLCHSTYSMPNIKTSFYNCYNMIIEWIKWEFLVVCFHYQRENHI